MPQKQANVTLKSLPFDLADIGVTPRINGAQVSFADLYGDLPSGSEQTVNIQDGLMAAQRAFFALRQNNMSLLDQLLPVTGVDFIIPNYYAVNCPIIVPEHVRLVCPFGIGLVGSGQLNGAITSRYTGNPTTKGLSNIYQPMIVLPHGCSTDATTLQIYCHNGSQATSGCAIGKNWVPNGISISVPGGNYAAGDTGYVANPSLSPYVCAQYTITSVDADNRPTAISLSLAGNYALPDGAQQRYWTPVNGYTGAFARNALGTVFGIGGLGSYATQAITGSGAGLEVTLSWTPDFAGGGADYNPGPNLQSNDVHGNIIYQGAGKGNDATYGKQFGILGRGLQIHGGWFGGSGGYYGIYSRATDWHVKQEHPIDAVISMNLFFGSSHECADVVIDTYSDCGIQIDGTTNCILKGTIFGNGANASGPAIRIGANTSSTAQSAAGLNLDFQINASANSASGPAVSLAYVRGSKINARVLNANGNSAGTLATNPFTYWGTIGTGVDASVELTGSIDTGNTGILTGNAFSGTSNINGESGGTVGPFISGAAQAITGDTTEHVLATITIPANTLKANGRIEIETVWTCTNNANAKTTRVKLGATSFLTNGLVSVAGCRYASLIQNANATNAQTGWIAASTVSYGTTSATPVSAAIDTTQAQTLTITGQLATGTDTLTLLSYRVTVLSAA